MAVPTKKQFYDYMSSIYGKYRNPNTYKTVVEIMKRADDINMLVELSELTEYNESQRLKYRYGLAVNGKELTPKQVDQHITAIEYALNHIDA
jgi:hypothetical protein